MTSGPRVNTQAPAGSPSGSALSMGHPNFKHINDAIYAAAEQLRDRPRERRKIIFLISDGQNAKNNTHGYDETLKLLLSADISVYAIGVGEANLTAGITFLGNNILAKYAHATGGTFSTARAARTSKGSIPASPSRRATSIRSPTRPPRPITRSLITPSRCASSAQASPCWPATATTSTQYR